MLYYGLSHVFALVRFRAYYGFQIDSINFIFFIYL